MRAFLRRLIGKSDIVIPFVRLSGAIGMVSPLRSGVSLATIEGNLHRAFRTRAPAVAILINSPGGSAVQSHLIFKRIRALADRHNKRVIVAVEDVAASGGYLVALAGDEIVVDPSSIVGSIGVVSAGFGFHKFIERIGVERRVHTAGESKAMLDPFQPEKADDVARLETLQREVHANFIELVRSRRMTLASDPELFTGAFWSGSRAVALGLADRGGDLRQVLRERYGEGVKLQQVGGERGFLRRRLGLDTTTTSVALIERVIAVIEERLLWGRYGL